MDEVRDRDEPWDVVVIGGGATGLGTLVEAASRGYDAVLVEQHDFGKGTSSRSTKLVHGGVRYLQQGNVSLVLEALRERGILRQNAPHLVDDLTLVLPGYRWWEKPFYGIGLKLYDLLARSTSFGRSLFLSRERTVRHLPTIEKDGLRGGVLYHDGLFDDTRLLVTLARTAAGLGGVPLNYTEVTDLRKSEGRVSGVRIRDHEGEKELEVRGRVVVNATGVFTDRIRRMDDPDARPSIVPSQGIHLVLDRSFLPGDSGLLIPSTDDGRVLFAIPWHERLLVGTTDTPVEEPVLEPRPLESEISYVLTHIGRYLSEEPGPEDVRSTFAGLRPLVKADGDHADDDTSEIARDHTVRVSPSGLVSVAGGKWTTYRKMGRDAVDQAAEVGDLETRPSFTDSLHLEGWRQDRELEEPWRVYGADVEAVRALDEEEHVPEGRLHPDLPYHGCQYAWAARNELARTVEDALARRTRALFLDAEASVEIAPRVASIMARELGRDEDWIEDQIDRFEEVAEGYRLRAPAHT